MKTVKTLTAAAMLAGTATAALAQDMPLVAFISPIASQPNSVMASEVMEGLSADLGWEYRILDANLSPDRQVSHVDTLISLGAEVISSWSLDPNAVAAAYTRANEAGIPVLGINSEGPGVTNTLWWELNLCVEGGTYERHAAWIAERNPEAKVIIMGGPPVPSIQANTACFTQAAEAAGLEIIGTADNNRDNAANASSLASDLLIRHPDVDVFWSYNDASALGISAAVMASGNMVYASDDSDGIMIFGMNGDEEAIEAIRQGRLTGTWDADSYAYGVGIIKAMQELLEHPGEELDDVVVKSIFQNYTNIDEYVPTMERNYTLETVPLLE
ncbi:sugar ABC transporter substrate-binding protein [Celeribacter sp.]|uniref:sugar ABC transporter substrate-binding protein n=1 Tax=Celeribacter sp. TaxID=1890673 RepID=UPI003A8EEB31